MLSLMGPELRGIGTRPALRSGGAAGVHAPAGASDELRTWCRAYARHAEGRIAMFTEAASLLSARHGAHLPGRTASRTAWRSGASELPST